MHRESSLVLAMKILDNLFDEDVIDAPSFYWNSSGTDEDMPNFWLKETNLQVEWYRDDPGRGGFTNQETFTASDAISLLEYVREEHDIWRDGK